MHRDSVEWNNLIQIQKIRNICAHQDGSILDKNGTEIEAIRKHIDSCEHLSVKHGDSEVFIDHGYLSYVYDVFTSYLQLIEKSIESTERA